MTEADGRTPYHIPEAEATATHRATALTFLRNQGCHHTSLEHDPDFDSYYCASCNIWAEPVCSDRRCIYCIRRPVIPSLAHRDR